MLTSKEIDNKLFFKHLNYFLVQDPLPESAEPTYTPEDNTSKFIIGHKNAPPEILNSAPPYTVPLYEFDNIKQYTDMFIEVVKKAVSITGNIQKCTNPNEEFANKLFTNKCYSILSAPFNKDLISYCNYFHFPIIGNPQIETNIIYCFKDPGFVGVCVCPENKNLELGLLLMADSICAFELDSEYDITGSWC